MEKKRFVVIDANSLIHRAYHALPPLRLKNGEPGNAVYGFLAIFLKAARELKPDFVATAFDSPAKTFRHQEFPDYKARRIKPPDDFYRQIPVIKKTLENFGVKIFEKESFEADDLIGTVVSLAEKQAPELEIILLSSDHDLLQLVSENVKAMILKKGISQTTIFDSVKVREKYPGLEPQKLVDFKALRGDPADNIPGVRGVGEKTALELINRFGDLETLYQKIDSGEAGIKPVLAEKLASQKTAAFLSRRLAEICREAPLELDLQQCAWEKKSSQMIFVLENLGFPSLAKRVVNH